MSDLSKITQLAPIITKQCSSHWGSNSDLDEQAHTLQQLAPHYCWAGVGFWLPTRPPLIPSGLEGGEVLITAGWWWKPWGSPRPSLTAPNLGGEVRLVTARWEWKSRLPMWSPLVLWGWGSGEYVLLLPGGDENPSSYLSFSEDTLAGCRVPWYSLADGWSLSFPIGLYWHGWESGHSFLCGFWLE